MSRVTYQKLVPEYSGGFMQLRLSLTIAAVAAMTVMLPKASIAESWVQVSPSFSAPVSQTTALASDDFQLSQIQRDTRSRVLALLSPSQQRQFNAAMHCSQDLKASVASLRLSSAVQKAQIRQVVNSEQRRAIAPSYQAKRPAYTIVEISSKLQQLHNWY
jgi:hypothetical protein